LVDGTATKEIDNFIKEKRTFDEFVEVCSPIFVLKKQLDLNLYFV
jgi:hypothetical protein